jgi:ADP-ribosylglycohydrolase
MSDLIKTVSEGLSEIQTEKLKSLAENIEFISEEDYKQKLILTKKKYFEQTKSEEKVEESSIDSDASTTLDESVSPAMAHYVQSISRTLKK